MKAARLASLALVGAFVALVASACSPDSSLFGTGGTGGSGGTGGGGGRDAGKIDFAACNGPGQCTLVASGCCDACGMPQLSGLTAVNKENVPEFKKEVCPEPEQCPGCETKFNPNLFAYCESGKCVGADMRTDPVSQCHKPADCKLRFGAGCCESCTGTEEQLTSVAINNENDLKSLVCSPGTVCENCMPQYPMGPIVDCGAEGHCKVVVFAPP